MSDPRDPRDQNDRDLDLDDEQTRRYSPPVEPATSVTLGPDETMSAGQVGLPDLRLGLGRLSRGLIAYGVIGLVFAALSLGVLVYVNNRFDTAGKRVETTMGTLATTIDQTATVLHDASTTAQSFTATLGRTEDGVRSAAATIVGVRTNLQKLESVLRTVNVLGISALGPAADAVGDIATQIEGLDTRLTAIADSLVTSGDSLAANGTSLGQLGDSTAAVAERLRSGVVQDSMADVHLVIVTMLLLMAAWAAVPAIGALAFGMWLRRELESSAV
ncbi:MAG: hypothetical protein ACJ779_10400 [Chloroflexota bacterium]